LPRLANEAVLENAILAGLGSTEYFAFAAGFDGKRYMGLKFNQSADRIEISGFLVKTDIAQKQLDEEAKQHPQQPGQSDEGANPSNTGDNAGGAYTPPVDGNEPDTSGVYTTETPKNRHFYLNTRLDNTRINRDVQQLMEEVISHLINIDSAQTEISLEVNVSAPNGLPPQTVRTVSENCRTLKVESFGFDE
jgi:hypothetical protein